MDYNRQRKIYVASSWRNQDQPAVVKALLHAGHLVYDFRAPRSDNDGFRWTDIDPDWQQWSLEQYIEALNHPVAKRGYRYDFEAMRWADTFVLVLPCGRSAHLELGWACGQGKTTAILLDDMEPELMAKMVDYLCPNIETLLEVLN